MDHQSKIIEDYRKIIITEVENSRNRIPESRGILDGMSNKLEAFKHELDKLDTKLATLGSQYVKENSLSFEEIEKVKEINRSALSSLTSSFH